MTPESNEPPVAPEEILKQEKNNPEDIVVENSESNTDPTQDLGDSTGDGWKDIGFHRPLAGLLFNLIFIFIAAGFGILLSIWLMPNVIYPFPEAMGFQNVTMQFFAVYFTLLDLGIGASIQRFVAEENVHNPRKAIAYIQFFIWYQMISGLLQVTVIAVWVLNFMTETEMAYAMWFFLIYSTVQYPGMLGVFRGTLEAYQRFDRASILGFIQTQVFENVMRIICILIGRWVGRNNPIIGEVVGAAAGSIVGTYLKDFITAIIAAYWVSPILKEVDPNYGIKAVFFVQFDKETVKKCLSFGLRVLVPGLISPTANFIAVTFMVAWLPNYSTILGMFLLGESLAHLVSTLQFSGIASTFSEAYLNGKHKLTADYLRRFYRWSAILGFFMTGLLFYGAYLIGIIVGENFFLVTPIIQHFLLFKICSIFAQIQDSVNTGVGKPEYNIILILCEQGSRLLVLWLMLVPYPSSWMALVYSAGVGWIVKWIVGYILFNWRILRVNLSWWQTFAAPALAAVVEAIYIWALYVYLFPVFVSVFGELVGAILGILIGIFTGPFFIFFPVYSLLGGWDDGSIQIMERAYELSGPSKPLIKIIKTISIKCAHISPLHNRFAIDTTGVEEEIRELTYMRDRSKITSEQSNE